MVYVDEAWEELRRITTYKLLRSTCIRLYVLENHTPKFENEFNRGLQIVVHEAEENVFADWETKRFRPDRLAMCGVRDGTFELAAE